MAESSRLLWLLPAVAKPVRATREQRCESVQRKRSMNTRQIAEMVGNLVRHQHHFEAMSTEDGQWVARNCETAIGLFIEAVKNRNNNQEQPETEVELPALLSVVVTTHLAAVAEKKTAKCFVGPLWYKHGRDSD